MKPGGDIPVDISHIVAELVFPYLRECHTTPFECGVVLSCEDVIAETTGLDLNLSYF